MSKILKAEAEAATGIEGDADLILTCARAVAVWHELNTIARADPWAPDRGRLNPRYEDLCKKRDALCRRVCDLGFQTTQGGTIALAQLAFIQADRDNQGVVIARDPDDWMALAVVRSVARASGPIQTSEERYA